VQPFGDRDPPATLTNSAQAALVRVPLIGGSPAAALYDVAATLQLETSSIANAPDAEKLLQIERDLLSDNRVMPLLFVPTVTWRAPHLHDVTDAPQWRLDSAWVTGDAR
jgi:hypothetical protein